jgi:hypothetical protein
VGGSQHDRHTWTRLIAGASGAARHGVHGRARLEVVHGNDLLLLPKLEDEGAGYMMEDSVGTVVEGVERGNHTAALDPDKASIEEVSLKLAGQPATRAILTVVLLPARPQVLDYSMLSSLNDVLYILFFICS